MTGIERLRAIAGAWDEWGLGGTLAEVADAIERELREERDRWDDDLSEAQVSWNAVAGVCLDMERHCLGHEGMEDSPVARWARELREAMKSDASDGSEAQSPSCADAAETADATSEAQKVTRDPAEDVSMSAYDLLPADERDAIAWVRDHGGLDYVRMEWDRRSNLKRTCEKLRSKVERQQRHVEFVQGKCRDRQGHIVELSKELADLRKVLGDYRDALGGMCERLGITDGTSLPEMPDVICEALDRRLMPEGYEWPLFEDGARVRCGDEFLDGLGHPHRCTSIELVRGNGEYGACDSFLHWNDDEPDEVLMVSTWEGDRVKRLAVLAADGEPLEVGQTVWDTDDETDTPLTVVEVSSDLVRCEYTWKDGKTYRPCYPPDQLTHQRPDTWQRIEEDAGCTATKYNERRGTIFTTKQQVARDLVCRCRALAERERGE